METSIIHSWRTNANEWIKIIENQEIESRKYTNNAIESVVKEMPEKKILDVGCGEGWLTRSMTTMGKEVTGVDAIEALLVYA